MQVNGSTPEPSPPGVVELREDIPLKVGSSFGGESSRCCGGGPRFILACFVALSAGITLALLTQIHYGDYEVVPHGSVSSSAANCSRAGTDVLKAGGLAMDAAAAAALCLAVLAPHRTSLDASGSLLYWEYRTKPTQQPTLVEWEELESAPWDNSTERPPKMLAAFAYLHAKLGVLPWSRVVQPAITIARESLSTAFDNPANPVNQQMNAYIADYLEKFQYNTSTELALFWNSDNLVHGSTPRPVAAGPWKFFAGGAGALVAGSALNATLIMSPGPDIGFERVVTALQQASLHGDWPPTGVASGLAVIDRLDNYVALSTGLSKPYGSGPASPEGWMYDVPKSTLDLAPAIIVAQQICGIRYVIGAESSGALAQAATALLTTDVGAGAIESPRVSVLPGGILAIEGDKSPPAAIPVNSTLVNSTLPYPAVNVVMQKGDALTSHADSRGGGLASRF